MKKIIIAIDGFSSTGKSTVAKQLAKKLGYVYVDTGAMYRAVTLYAMQHNFISKEYFKKEKLINSLAEIKLEFHFNTEKGFAEIYLNGKNVENEIRTLSVSQFVSTIAAVPEVRKMQVKQQHELGEKKGIVMDGRDIGTVVFPQAELKIFMTASAETRAKRRFDELIAKGENVTFQEVIQNIEERDKVDSSRKDSPLKKAEDAIVVDNSHLNPDEQFQKILQLAKEKIKA
ncbi:(d)CMP kinase [Mesonia maritima]|uniref:Cytidylate kinase n=1 Tax=Mesonia maritima TaxID=1793873 RepID=A0ABU1K4A9_9FLAO|nr:(d)CMP kinase [Mesonia maritima]MDR6300443.1 cytidylate kinase [Mesonia maritima]